MAYRFAQTKTIEKEILRLANEQINLALSHLTTAPITEENIHEARKTFKRLRGLLQLIRFSLPKAVYIQENRAIRDIGRLLAHLRDRAALIEAVEKLQQWERFAEFELDAAPLLTALRKDLTESTSAEPVTSAVEQLQLVQNRLPTWAFKSTKIKPLMLGVLLVYGEGKKLMKIAYQTEDSADFHEWRKYAKYLWYQISLLEESWPTLLTPLKMELRDLGELLGDDHDLTVLELFLAGWDSAEHSQWSALIAKRKKQLRKRASILGQRLYAESAEAFTHRLTKYWKIWRLN